MSITCMSEALPNDSEESEKKPEETPGDTTPDSGSPEIKPEVPLSDQIDQIQGAYYELLGQSFYIVWKTAEPGIIAVAGLGLSYIVINFIISFFYLTTVLMV